jgi:hypothetical protein
MTTNIFVVFFSFAIDPLKRNEKKRKGKEREHTGVVEVSSYVEKVWLVVVSHCYCYCYVTATASELDKSNYRQ